MEMCGRGKIFSLRTAASLVAITLTDTLRDQIEVVQLLIHTTPVNHLHSTLL